MDKKERLNALIKYYSEGKPTLFAKKMGVAPSTISSWLSRNAIDYDLVFAKCEHLSPLWLLTGQGSMRHNDNAHVGNISAGQDDARAEVYLSMYKDKDAEVKELYEQIGALKERIAQLERGKGRDVSDAHTSGIANVG